MFRSSIISFHILFSKSIHLRFTFLTLFRFVGVGEASFVSLAAPFIDDNAPHDQVVASGMYLFSQSMALDKGW